MSVRTIEANMDDKWNNMLELAIQYQQRFYELLPDWSEYQPDEHKYLKQNIGFALFGSPEKDHGLVCYSEEGTSKNDNIADIPVYAEEASNSIELIYDKICTFGKMGNNPAEPVYLGIIYNVILIHTKHKMSNKDEKDTNQSQMHSIPIFRIRKYSDRSSYTSGNAPEPAVFTSWYIDTTGRVYKSWTDYKTNNLLPECTMVLPKDGFYQPNFSYPVTEEFSVVCITVEDSPACSSTKTFLKTMDTASNVMGLGSLGLGLAAFLTPVGPIVAGAGLATAGVSSVWTTIRSCQNLHDRSIHEESISLTDKNAFPSWLAIAGSAAGIATSGGALLISRAAQKGANVTTVARYAFNSVVIGSLVINGVGIGYQGYNLYDKYMRGEDIETVDILYFGTHILFFGSTVINVNFANDIIRSTQGKIVQDYENSLASKRHRKAFRTMKRKIAKTNTDTDLQNNEIIRRINAKIKTPSDLITGGLSDRSFRSNPTCTSIFMGGKFVMNGITLIEPIMILRLILDSRKKASSCDIPRSSSADIKRLKHLLHKLLSNFYCNEDVPLTELHTIDDFDPVLKEMAHEQTAEEILRTLFEIATILVKNSKYLGEFIDDLIWYLWGYVKANLKYCAINGISNIKNKKVRATLREVVNAVFKALDVLVDSLVSTFKIYIKGIQK